MSRLFSPTGLAGAAASFVYNEINEVLSARGIVSGVIHDVFAHTGTYIVSTAGGRRQMAASLADVSVSPLGARDITQFNIHDHVLCYFPPNSDYGYILGAAPHQIYDGRLVLPDSLVMRSLAGFIQDQMHYTAYQKEDNDLPNFSCGRPADALPGDWGKINDLGLAIWLGRFVAQLRASDAAKIEAFWGDDLLRMVAYNYQRFLAGSELTAVDDQGEFDEVEYWTPFMWEALGAYEPNTAALEEYAGQEGALKQDNEKSRFEPKEAEQVIVPRVVAMRGYIGDLEHTRVVLPPPGASGVAKRDDDKDFRGVASIHTGLDGSLHLRSAREIVIEKSLIMPVPRRLRDPDAPDGDTDKNYKAANVYGDGETQEQKPFEWDDDPNSRAMTLWEYHAYLFGKYGLQTIDAHKKDWATPEEAELHPDEGEPNEIDKDLFTGLGFDFTAKLPKYAAVGVDQRDGHIVRYYRSRAGLYILDDGSVIIEDGYGSQIIMSGGNIQYSCQGDIISRPGRSSITWAPRDIINRAGWCAELSAAKKDVRIKAEKNLHMLSNNESSSSVLIECRAKQGINKSDWSGNIGEDIEASGIIIKSDEGAIALWTKELFGGVPEDGNGTVEFNAGSGQAILAGGHIGVEALNEFSAIVGPQRGSTTKPPQFIINSGRALLRSKLDIVGDLAIWPGSQGAGSLRVGGSAAIKNSLQLEGFVQANGHFISPPGGKVGKGGSFSFTPDPTSEGAKQDGEADIVKQRIFVIGFDEPVLEDEETGLGNEDVQAAVGFSFRKSLEHYKTDEEFHIYESRWQQLYRANGATTTWDEPVVLAPTGEETMPHPGKDAWDGDSKYRYLKPGDAVNVDYTKGVAKKRDEQSEKPPDAIDAKLSEQYIINIQESE